MMYQVIAGTVVTLGFGAAGTDIRDIYVAGKALGVSTQLPGRGGGPADLYRHISGAAELTRKAA